ncbi:hypothetical protein B0H13DRAFT_1868426 [Mycena leptocephala]|nr:hypothetical protein B0H13DRAFT_1868426 [Mycena leptocephala]
MKVNDPPVPPSGGTTPLLPRSRERDPHPPRRRKQTGKRTYLVPTPHHARALRKLTRSRSRKVDILLSFLARGWWRAGMPGSRSSQRFGPASASTGSKTLGQNEAENDQVVRRRGNRMHCRLPGRGYRDPQFMSSLSPGPGKNAQSSDNAGGWSSKDLHWMFIYTALPWLQPSATVDKRDPKLTCALRILSSPGRLRNKDVRPLDQSYITIPEKITTSN